MASTLDVFSQFKIPLRYFSRGTKRCHGDFLINQILTTHGCFPVHQHRIFGKSPDSECGRDQGTVSHYVYGCQIYREVRQNYFPKNFFQLGILELILNTRAKIGLKIILVHTSPWLVWRPPPDYAFHLFSLYCLL
ncbi:hypothetical protein AVEN_96725-1 [Araneus ventricosus]|uniref:Uncharacterized protein n=1 Tax=Araneus ventricosus TaxID=182803 RepID=A0A4Y2EBI0_ARAVE|nr:hypothetical protein AVEN_96725-1 [Araneus ventricosus]